MCLSLKLPLGSGDAQNFDEPQTSQEELTASTFQSSSQCHLRDFDQASMKLYISITTQQAVAEGRRLKLFEL
jgi:hypothetical protein